MALTEEQRKAAQRRRQREYRDRQKGYKNNLESKAFKADVLEDAIKLAANKGDRLSKTILKEVAEPTVANLAQWFQQRAKAA